MQSHLMWIQSANYDFDESLTLCFSPGRNAASAAVALAALALSQARTYSIDQRNGNINYESLKH